jgi:hypothetical protein
LAWLFLRFIRSSVCFSAWAGLHSETVSVCGYEDTANLSALSRNTFTRCAVFSPPFIGEKNGVLFAFSRLFRASGAFAGFK